MNDIYEIEFSCADWAIRKYAPIEPAKKFLPKEFVQIKETKSNTPTVKNCIAIIEMLSAGYVIPAWADITVDFDSNDKLQVCSSNDNYGFSDHKSNQIQDMFKKFDVRDILKIENPWHIKTKPNWSAFWLPLHFHNFNYEAIPAIVNLDKIPNHNPINLMFYKKIKTEIKLGDPLIQIIPFKRNDVNGLSRDVNEKDYKRMNSLFNLKNLSFQNWNKFFRSKLRYNLKKEDLNLQ